MSRFHGLTEHAIVADKQTGRYADDVKISLGVVVVVPILQARGLFQTEYRDPTLRGRLGLAHPRQLNGVVAS